MPRLVHREPDQRGEPPHPIERSAGQRRRAAGPCGRGPQAGATSPAAYARSPTSFEHQGTLRMGYFLHQVDLDPNVEEARFRYHGPTPCSKETGIMMLADGCEAALRSASTRHQRTGSQEHGEADRRSADQRWSAGPEQPQPVLAGRPRHSFVRVWRRMRHRRSLRVYPIPAKRRFSA